MEQGEMKFKVPNDKVCFQFCKIKKQQMELHMVSVINVVDKNVDRGYLKDKT